MSQPASPTPSCPYQEFFFFSFLAYSAAAFSKQRDTSDNPKLLFFICLGTESTICWSFVAIIFFPFKLVTVETLAGTCGFAAATLMLQDLVPTGSG